MMAGLVQKTPDQYLGLGRSCRNPNLMTEAWIGILVIEHKLVFTDLVGYVWKKTAEGKEKIGFRFVCRRFATIENESSHTISISLPDKRKGWFSRSIPTFGKNWIAYRNTKSGNFDYTCKADMMGTPVFNGEELPSKEWIAAGFT